MCGWELSTPQRVYVSDAERPAGSAACDGVLRLWDGRTGSCVRTWTGHTDAILDMWVAPDGKTVCTGSEDGTVRVFLA